MMVAQGGDGQTYEQLLRELDAWLLRYYARRLPHPAAEDARQEALLAIHAKRHSVPGFWRLRVANGSTGFVTPPATRHYHWIRTSRSRATKGPRLAPLLSTICLAD
jgi:hypothetical protein